jgi:predicted transposase YbfD/YdcC
MRSTKGTLLEYFRILPDPRRAHHRNKRHALFDIIIIAIVAVICGADSWVDIETFGRKKERWLKQFLPLSNGIPSHDTFARVFSILDPNAFQKCFFAWIEHVRHITEGEVVAIDGKTVRRAYGKDSKPIHLISAFATEKGHGREESRECWMTNDLSVVRDKKRWHNLTSIARITDTRTVHGKTSTATRYFISSLDTSASEILKAVRAHWGVENSLHWTLDIAFREDESRTRIGHAQQNLALVRKIALNILRNERTAKGGVKSKRLQAGWDNGYLLDVLKTTL